MPIFQVGSDIFPGASSKPQMSQDIPGCTLGIQQRMSGFVNYLSRQEFSRPEVKNVGMLLSWMLKWHAEAGRDRATNAGNERREKPAAFREKRFCIIDFSDITSYYYYILTVEVAQVLA